MPFAEIVSGCGVQTMRLNLLLFLAVLVAFSVSSCGTTGVKHDAPPAAAEPVVAPAPELVRGRKGTLHNNLLGDGRNMGLDYVDQDVVVDGDFVSGRTGGHCHLFAHKIIQLLDERE